MKLVFSGLLITAICFGFMRTQTAIRYVALGDSYTICEGARKEEAWPVLLTKHLTRDGIKTELVANPSRTGWTTQNLIDYELDVFDKSNADFVTLCIGVNDWVQGFGKNTFRMNLIRILDHLQKKLTDKSNIVLLLIPDFSVTRVGKVYCNERDGAKGISEFNGIILQEARKRNLRTVDLFTTSKDMKNDATLVAKDDLHPSAKEYAIWETLIYPVAKVVIEN